MTWRRAKKIEPGPDELERTRISINVFRNRSGQWGVYLPREKVMPCKTRDGAVEVGRIIGRLIATLGGEAELTVFDTKGKVDVKDTYGHDPRDTKG